jgi:hypothetical protein
MPRGVPLSIQLLMVVTTVQVLSDLGACHVYLIEVATLSLIGLGLHFFLERFFAEWG